MEFECGNLAQPLYAIPPRATAQMQLRFPVGVDHTKVIDAVRRQFVATDLRTFPSRRQRMPSSLQVAWIPTIRGSVALRTRSSKPVASRPAVLPNLGGSLPNNIFSDLLGLPTIWIPHSYPGCKQHGADEHIPVSIVREGLSLMAGLYWDIGMSP